MAKIKVKVYACRFCEAISTNPLDFLDTAIDAGSIWGFDDWVAEEYGSCGLLDVVKDFANEGKSATEVVAYVRDKYNQQMATKLLTLFEDARESDWYYDEIELDVSLIGSGVNRALICSETETHVVQG